MTDTVQSLRDWAYDRESNDWGDFRRTLLLKRAADDIARLEAERNALLSHCIDEVAPRGTLRDRGFTHQVFDGWAVSRPGAADEDAVPVLSCHHSYAEAEGAVRRAAGLDVEDMTCPS